MTALSSNPSQNPETALFRITDIQDETNKSIMYGTLYTSKYKVLGSGAEPNKLIEVFNIDEKVGQTTSDSLGEWATPLIDVTKLGCYGILAVGKWGIEPIALEENFTAGTRDPIIGEVLDAEGKPIADNASLRGTAVTVKGNAVPRQNAELFNGDTSIATEPVNQCGEVEFALDGLVPGTYRIKIKAGNGNESRVFTFTLLAAAVAPTLVKVTDAQGNEIPKDSTTFQTTVIVEGAGEKGDKIGIYNGTTLLKEGTVDVTTGLYRIQIDALTPQAYSLTAVNDAGTSAPWPFTVADSDAPTDTRVHDSEKEVVDGGTTLFSWVLLRGKTEPDGTIKVKVNGTVAPKEHQANQDGVWTTLLTGLEVGKTYVVSAVRADNPAAESNTVSFSRIA
ncbi:hypothetical protein [Pseudomonas sp. MYb118]|uniref:hypothetical protein n=1 Tax=Pseudomonas sp. MYb118 TaxID=1848720 RepID=UPI0034CD84FD